MKLLSIETSCDETAAAILEKTDKEVTVISNVVATSLTLHSQTGGIIPEVAAREQVKFIIPVIKEALAQANLDDKTPAIDAIAVTYGPGLIGSLLVGVETAKTLAVLWDKPLIPVNHLYGHIYANTITYIDIAYPAIGLIVSGGHTDLVYMKDEKTLEWLGGTRDDAAGECFDKSGRLLDLPYPAGPAIERLAKHADPKAFHFPRARLDTPYDFSFSGLKTAVRNEVMKLETKDEQTVANMCYAVQDAVFDMLITTTLRAATDKRVKTILLGGGVIANQTLVERFTEEAKNTLGIPVIAPDRKYCTDNAVMIGAAALLHPEMRPWEEVTANPELYFD